MKGDVLSLEKKSPAKASGKSPAGVRDQVADKERDMGEALRSVYDRAVKEAVPDDLLDLLSKLD